MKKLIALTIVCVSSCLYAATPLPHPQIKEEQSTSSTDTKLQSYMIIDPKARAMDLQQAYDVLRKEKNASKINFQITGGQTITNIVEMTLMNNGNLILFRYNTAQGIKLQAVPVEEILSINHS